MNRRTSIGVAVLILLAASVYINHSLSGADTQKGKDGHVNTNGKLLEALDPMRSSWKPSFQVPRYVPGSLGDDARLDARVTASIPGWSLARALESLSVTAKLHLIPSREVQDLKVIIVVDKQPVRQVMLSLARLFRLRWRERVSSLTGERSYILVRTQNERNFLTDINNAESDYFKHRLTSWLHSTELVGADRDSFRATHPEVWGSVYTMDGGSEDNEFKIPQLLRVLGNDQLDAIVSGQRVDIPWSSVPSDLASTLESWIIPDTNNNNARIVDHFNQGSPSGRAAKLGSALELPEDALKYAVMEISPNSESGAVSCSSEIVFKFVNLNLPSVNGRTHQFSLGAKPMAQDSPIYIAINGSPADPGDLPIPKALVHALAHRSSGLDEQTKRSSPTIDLPLLITKLAHAAHLSILSDYHYSRGPIPRASLDPMSAEKTGRAVLDHWRLDAKFSSGIWTFRDREWWIYDPLDVPESFIAEIEGALNRGPHLDLQAAGSIAESISPKQFEALTAWRLPQIKCLSGSFQELKAVASLTPVQLQQAETELGLPLSQASKAIVGWAIDSLDSDADYPAWKREQAISEMLQGGSFRVVGVGQDRKLPNSDPNSDQPYPVNLVIQTPDQQVVEREVWLPCRPMDKQPGSSHRSAL